MYSERTEEAMCLAVDVMEYGIIGGRSHPIAHDTAGGAMVVATNLPVIRPAG